MRWSRTFGVVAPELGWVPPPNFLLRRDRILRTLKTLSPSRVLEVGCGAGALSVEAARAGFSCVALETSPKGLETVSRLAAAAGVKVRASAEPADDWRGAFPLLMAFEVLEHIEDDEGALRQWNAWLQPGGTLLLSVPAHAAKWGAGDVWAGHFRRYERADLTRLLEATGFRVERLESWGFPTANLLQPIGNRIYASRLRKREGPVNMAEASAESGVERDLHVRLAWLLTNPLSAVAIRVLAGFQGLFARSDLGVGYYVVATKAG